MRILIIEDEHRIANTIKKGLEQERYAVDVTYDGETGLDRAFGEEYDLLIIDRMLPGIDGVDICKQLRKKENHVPILLLTAKGQIRDRVEGLDAGADDYLIKPFSFEELLARVRALIRRPPTVLDSTLTVKDLSLNTLTHEVKRGEKIIHLSVKEFSLLEYLLRHLNTTLTKDQLIQHVWDYDADILPNTVEVNIKNLRKKVDLPFPNKEPLIQTIRGFGYKLKAD